MNEGGVDETLRAGDCSSLFASLLINVGLAEGCIPSQESAIFLDNDPKSNSIMNALLFFFLVYNYCGIKIKTICLLFKEEKLF